LVKPASGFRPRRLAKTFETKGHGTSLIETSSAGEIGRLELIDPRAGAHMLQLERNAFEGRYLVEPMPGLMVMFPSWLKHMVHPFHGSGERISISFNITVQIQQ
jgi:uncharacterized protein (TIGR02466 family)